LCGRALCASSPLPHKRHLWKDENLKMVNANVSSGDLLTVASLVAGFSGNIFVFRLQREVGPDVPLGSRTSTPLPWIPLADKMLFACVVLLLVFTVLPILVFSGPEWLNVQLSRAACSAAIVLFTSYIPVVVVHYRRYFWGKTEAARRLNLIQLNDLRSL
jgi:hypothetical protein